MNLNGRTINPAEMRTRVVLKRRTVVNQPGGFQVPTYVRVAEVWSRWLGVHGAEVWASEAINAVGAATVLIRYRAGIDTTIVAEMGGDDYEVVSVDNIQQRNEYIELKVKRAGAG